MDDFLSEKLNSMEQLPDEHTFNRMVEEMGKLHPIDYSLKENLQDFSPLPDKGIEQQLFSSMAGNPHSIDSALSQKLSTLKETPEQNWAAIQGKMNFSSGKRKLRTLLLLLIGLAAFTSVYLLNSQDGINGSIKNSNESGNGTKGKIGVENQTGIEKSSTAPMQSFSTQNKSDKNGNVYKKDNANSSDGIYNNKSTGNEQLFSSEERKNKRSGTKNILMADFQKSLNVPNKQFSDGVIFGSIPLPEKDYLKLNGLMKINTTTRPDTIDEMNVAKSSRRSYLHKKLSPFYVGANFGYINEHTISDKISTKNVHKDAVTVFGQATGKDRKGYDLGVYAGYRLNRNFSVKLGILYTKTKIRSDMNYIYTDVPIHDSANGGAIVAYYKRTLGNSPTVESDFKNENIAFYMPVQFSARFFESNKFSAWGEVGTNILLKSKFRTQLFSFDQVILTDPNLVKLQKLTPTGGIILEYQFLPELHFIGKVQVGYQRKRFYMEDYSYLKTEFVPSFNFGIIYNPLIRQ